MKPFLSIKEASEYLGLEYKTVYRLVRAGEIPAARLGGVYRIKLADLENYFEQQKQRVASRNGEKADALSVSVLRCGHCLRVIRDAAQFAGKCQAPDCVERLCDVCWREEGARFCAQHEPTRAEWTRRALDDYAQGLIPKPITAEHARQAELNYLSRFDRKVREQATFRLPQSDKTVRPKDWDAVNTRRDQIEQVKQWIRPFDLEEVDLTQMPVNASSTYAIAEAAGKQPGLHLTAQCYAHLETLLRRGVDFEPVELAELLDLLQAAMQNAEQANVYLVCAYASPTGWSAAARDYIGGKERSKIFSHRLVMPILVDLAEDRVYRDPLDTRLADFEYLFSPRLRQEQIEDARAYLERALVEERRSLAAKDVAQTLTLPVEVVVEAFTRLAKDERFKIIEMPGIGPVAALRA